MRRYIWDERCARVGHGSIDSVDTAGSLEFLASWHGGVGSLPLPGTRALDCGAGIGRVSEGVLLRVCEAVQLVEVSETLLTKARERLGTERCVFTATSLRDFEPQSEGLDLVWLQ